MGTNSISNRECNQLEMINAAYKHDLLEELKPVAKKYSGTERENDKLESDEKKNVQSIPQIKTNQDNLPQLRQDNWQLNLPQNRLNQERLPPYNPHYTSECLKVRNVSFRTFLNASILNQNI